jgi:hypothetical protein
MSAQQLGTVLPWKAFPAAVLVLVSPHAAMAQVIVNFQQIGGNVVATGSGSIDTTNLTLVGNTNNSAFVWANFPLGGSIFSTAIIGGTAIVPEDVYSGITGPSNFGSGGQFFATSGSGDVFGVLANDVLDVPAGYASGSPLSATSTWSGATISNLGLTPGSYTWTWGSGPPTDSFTLNIGVVPEPGALTMVLAAGLAGICTRMWGRGRRLPARCG